MARNLITSVLSQATNLLPSIRASAHVPSSSSNSNSSERQHAQAVEEELGRLMRTLERIKATLYDSEEREIRDRSVKLWLKELKKVSYDAEDVLSEYQYEVARVKVEARKALEASSCSHKGKQMESIEYIVPIPDDMVDRLIKIRSRFDEIAKDREALQLRESDGVKRLNNKILLPLMGHMVDEASIFGRGAEITKVINFLLSEKEKSFSVISIVGKGGLGKTTIAQLVYKDRKVSRCFDLFGWVCVSQEFDVRRLTKATIESICKSNNGVSELSPLQEELANTVKGKTVLLVLDDVWNENQSLWELFRVPFKEAKMVRILVTTRNKKVADVMLTTTLFRPSNLPESSCWQLFQHYAFSGTTDIVPTHLIDMGREIMRKCGGLPLAVKSIASLLRHETYEECWREILETDLWESNPSNDIFPALQVSYAHLPAHLKPCFLFCSMHPKDYLLKKMNLIELWISHGYIESKGKRRITEIGVEYYEELKQRSFLDGFSDGCSEYEYCKLHDIVHDLARLNSENEHYSVEINWPCEIQEKNVLREAYHLYTRGFIGCANQILQQNLKGLRTLSMDRVGHSKEVEGILTKIESLRVLKLEGDFTEIPHSIFKLKHLAYLGVTSSRLKMLPLSIGLLYNLQTLILDCDSLEYLPESIGDLANLQFLYIQSIHIKKLPKSLCSLSNLLRLAIGCYHLKKVPLYLRNLSTLHELTISSSHTLALPNTIGCLSSLEKLNLWSHGDRNKFNYLLGYVPHGLVSFPAIKKMAAGLRVRNIAWLKDMTALEGTLSIEGLRKSNLVDAQHANLRNKCKLQALDLCWDHDLDYDLSWDNDVPFNYFNPDWKTDLRLRLRLEDCEDGLVSADDRDFSLLEYLQPHPNLKKLCVRYYHSATVPEWMSDPFSLQSIQELRLEFCYNIQSLPFRNLHTLKHLTIEVCDSIRVLQLEHLPYQLEELHIGYCDHLELITGPQLVGSTEPIGDFSHGKPRIGRQSISSLTSYCQIIRLCCVLQISNQPNAMLQVYTYVRIALSQSKMKRWLML
ncbi:putative disease resistance protein RGA1 [Carex rostrata]